VILAQFSEEICWSARLASTGFALPGTLADRMTRCGHRGCRCRADPPRLHGPYHQWTRKKNGKTSTRILTDDQLADYAPGSTTTAACASSSPNSRHSASPSPKPTPAGTASQTAPPSPGTASQNRKAASGKRGLSSLNPWAALQPAYVCPGQP